MGAWKYCDKCNHELEPVTFREVFLGVQVCPDCKNETPLKDIFNIDTEKEFAIDDFLERLDTMEKRLTELELNLNVKEN